MSIRYVEKTVFQGIYQEQECLELCRGVRLVRLGNTLNALHKSIPRILREQHATLSALGLSGLPQATMLCVDAETDTADAFRSTVYGVGEGPEPRPPIGNPYQMCEALSLVCNGNVSPLYHWKDFDDTPDLAEGLNFFERRITLGTSTALTQELLNRAGDLYEKLGRQPFLRGVARRWANCVATLAHVDGCIDLRIALESLFLGKGQQELRYRLALTGAWYLGKDSDERIEHYRVLKNAYDMCSTAVHTGRLGKSVNSDVLVEAQDLCRKALLKRLDDGKAPDWTTLVLGG